jgi:hypothetical protein
MFARGSEHIWILRKYKALRSAPGYLDRSSLGANELIQDQDLLIHWRTFTVFHTPPIATLIVCTTANEYGI